MTIDELNDKKAEDAVEALLECCGSQTWAKRMAKARPFRDIAALTEAADSIWSDLDKNDWLEAFAAHPRIGDVDTDEPRLVHTRKWASDEQSRVASASETVRALLAEGNRRYEERFGHIFVVFASGKSAGQMLRLLKDRMKNKPADEIKIAAAEQQKITHFRLQKMIDAIPADE